MSRLLVLLVGLSAATASVVAPGAWAAAPEKLQPGMYLEAPAGNGCTANFVYDGIESAYGRVFLGTAAHCVQRRGEQITSGGETIGTVAVVGSADATATDWALIEIAPQLHSRIDPSLVGHPDLPRGTPLTPEEATRGDEIQFDGYGQGFDQTAATREGRSGLLQTFTAEEVRLLGPVSTGDSGGPAVHVATGRPLAVLTSIQAAFEGSAGDFAVANVNGPTAVGVVAQAALAGVPVRLRTIDSAPVPAPPAAPQSPPQGEPVPPATHPRQGSDPGRKSAAKRGRPSRSAAACRARARKAKKASKRRAALKRCSRTARAKRR
jgi:hypothetical protein